MLLLAEVPVELLYVLYMNPITAQAESCVPVATFDTHEEGLAFYKYFQTEPYTDEVNGRRWLKSFKKGSPLENFNALDEAMLLSATPDHHGCGLVEKCTVVGKIVKSSPLDMNHPRFQHILSKTRPRGFYA